MFDIIEAGTLDEKMFLSRHCLELRRSNDEEIGGQAVLYLICDNNNNNLVLDGIPLYGKERSILAIFLHEQDALDVLVSLEAEGAAPGTHIVREIAQSFSDEQGYV
jgi:hypothetical protein